MTARAVGVLALLLVAASPAAAEEPMAPDALVKQTTERVLALLEEKQDVIEDDPSQVFAAVQEIVLPHFDFELMSRFVLARNWEKASAEQRERFTEQFRRLLVRTYGRSLSEYSGQSVRFPPMQSDTERGRVKVPTEVEQDDGPNIPISYSLYLTEDDGWKVFDVVVEGSSLVQTYRSSFTSEVRSSGIDGLIEKLTERNDRGVASGSG